MYVQLTFCRYQVTGVPDLKLFRKGQAFPYAGPPEAAGADGKCI